MNEQTRLPWARYAIEFTILFLGVFLAFLSDGYRESLQEREREREYLQAIACELNDEIKEVNEVVLHYKRKIKRMDRFFDLVKAPTSPSDSIEATLQNFVFNFPYAATPNTAYESMKSSGDLRLIRDNNLRFSLIRLETSRTDAQGQEKILMDFLIGAHATFMQSFYDYDQAISFDPSQIRKRETLSRLRLCRVETNSYYFYLSEHLDRLRNMQHRLSALTPCSPAADSSGL